MSVFSLLLKEAHCARSSRHDCGDRELKKPENIREVKLITT
jgi:hypothetical protein